MPCIIRLLEGAAASELAEICRALEIKFVAPMSKRRKSTQCISLIRLLEEFFFP